MVDPPRLDLVAPTAVSDCDREPIRIPGSVQPQGALIVVDASDGLIVAASESVRSHLELDPEALLGQPVHEVFADVPFVADLQLGEHGTAAAVVPPLRDGGPPLEVAAHAATGTWRLEFVPVSGEAASAGGASDISFEDTRQVMETLLTAADVEELCNAVTQEVRRVTGFDRVMVYRFEPNWDGYVLAEARDEHAESWLGLRYPAADIPSQARALYEHSPIRLIRDAADARSPLFSRLDDPIDLSDATLRSPSPVHCEYLANMGVRSSMSISILRADGRLWGLIACHADRPRHVDASVRSWCRLVGELTGVQIGVRERAAADGAIAMIEGLVGPLTAAMGPRMDIVAGLATTIPAMAGVLESGGAAYVRDDAVAVRWGDVPDGEALLAIARWYRATHTAPIWSSRVMPAGVFPNSDGPAGLLVLDLGTGIAGTVIFFRPEMESEVAWAGAEAAIREARSGPTKRLDPRGSFNVWRTTVRGHSAEWSRTQLHAADRLRTILADQVVVQAERRVRALQEDVLSQTRELQSRNETLLEFTYVASHDLQEPIRKIMSFCDLLVEDLGDGLTPAAEEDVRYILDGAERMSRLVTDLLSLSRIGRSGVVFDWINLDEVVNEAEANLGRLIDTRRVTIERDELPVVRGDRTMLVQLYQNLIGNAVKFSDEEGATIHLTVDRPDDRLVFGVRDSGIGIDPAFVEQVFLPFKRLHAVGRYDGSGIGLSICRKAVEAHAGRIWVESEGLGQGSWFRFELNAEASEDEASRV